MSREMTEDSEQKSEVGGPAVAETMARQAEDGPGDRRSEVRSPQLNNNTTAFNGAPMAGSPLSLVSPIPLLTDIFTNSNMPF
jgi:hypothetical protein